MLFRMTNLIFFIYSSCQSPNALHEPLRVCVALSAHQQHFTFCCQTKGLLHSAESFISRDESKCAESNSPRFSGNNLWVVTKWAVENPHALAGDGVSAREEERSRLSQDWPTLHTWHSTAQASHDRCIVVVHHLHDTVASHRRSEDTVSLTRFNYHHLCLWEDMTDMGSQASRETPNPGLKEDMGWLLIPALLHKFLDDGHVSLHDGKWHLPLLLRVLLHRCVHDQKTT